MSETEKRGLILLRTHFVDDRIAEMARAYAAGGDYDVMIAVDETAGPIDSLGVPKLSISLDSCARMGLPVACEQPLWRCGDYLFYHALAVRPGYRQYWLIEYDITLNFADPLDFFRFFDREAAEDYISTFLELADPKWYWYKAAARRFPVVYASGFAVVRLSVSAIARLLERRRFEAARLIEDGLAPNKYWLNDESYVSSAAPELALSVADLNKYGDFYTAQTLMRRGVWHPAQLPAPDSRIYHAVRSGASYLRSIKSYYEFDLDAFFTWAEADLPDFADAATHLLAERLAKVPDDPSAVFGPGGALAGVTAHFRQSHVAAALMRALARRRLRLCLEAVQFGRIATPIARTEAHDNVALGRPAWQSSTSPRSRKRSLRRDAEGGNDGDRQAEYGFHTAMQNGPWWAVDLGAEYPVRLVRLFNRRIAEHRLKLFVIETSADFVTWAMVHAHQSADMRGLRMRPIEIGFDPPVAGRYWRVRLAREGVLHLAEVEVMKA